MSDSEHKRGTPSASDGETKKPEPIVDDDVADERNQSVFGSEGSGGETSPARPHDRKNRS